MIADNEYYLVTTNNWFYGPDGQQYRAVWGRAKVINAKEVFGVNPTHMTNWFMKIGDGDKSVLVAGCQIHYAVRSDKRPEQLQGTYKTNDGDRVHPMNAIYFTE